MRLGSDNEVPCEKGKTDVNGQAFSYFARRIRLSFKSKNYH